MALVTTKLSDLPPDFNRFISYFVKSLSERVSKSKDDNLKLFLKNLRLILEIKD